MRSIIVVMLVTFLEQWENLKAVFRKIRRK